jgi:hypothetical protein
MRYNEVKTRFAAALLSLAALALFTDGGVRAHAQRVENALGIEPDPDLQGRLENVMKTLLEPGVKVADQLYAIGTLADARKDEERFFRQLVYFFDRRMRQGRTDDAIYMLAMISDLRLTSMTIARVLTPYVDAPDPALREFVRELLGGVETRDARGALDFSYYAQLLSPDPPAGLVKYMYERSPGTALFTLARVYGKRPRDLELEWAEHVVADAVWKQDYFARSSRAAQPPGRDAALAVERSVREARAELGSLSGNPGWWVRLYVAEMLRQHPAFRTPELVARLATDKHPLVREAMGFAAGKPEKPPKPGAPQSPSAPAKPPISKESTKGP